MPNLSLNALLTAQVIVTFPRWCNGGYDSARASHYRSPVNGGSVWTYTVNLPTVAGYDTFAGVPGTAKVFHDACKAVFTNCADSAPVNATQLANMAQQIAKDYYDGLSEGLDVTYPGVQPWQPEGVNDLMFTLATARAQTRIQHKPYNFATEEFAHRASSSSSSSSASSVSSSSSSSSQSSSSSSSNAASCNQCSSSSVAQEWTVTFTGVTNGTCTGCTGINGTWTLAYISNCNWIGTITGSACATTINLFYNAGQWNLYVWNGPILSGTFVVSYTGSINCDATSTLTFNLSGGSCNGWAGTVTINPAP